MNEIPASQPAKAVRRQVPPDRPRHAGRDERQSGPEPRPDTGQHDRRDARGREQEHRGDADPRSNTGSNGGTEHARVDPRHRLGIEADRDLVALDPPDHPPEAELPKVAVPRCHRGPRSGRARLRARPPGFARRLVATAPRLGPSSGLGFLSTRSRCPRALPRWEFDVEEHDTGQGCGRRAHGRLGDAGRPLSHHPADRRRRDGRGLPRARRRAGPRGRDQGPAPLARRRPGVRRPVPPRGARRRDVEPPEHRHRLRLGRRRRHLLHGDGVRARPVRARGVERARRPRPRPGRRRARPDPGGARARARERDRPPRSEAGEHPDHDRGRREAHRPRARAGLRRREEHPRGRGDRHGPVPLARADPRRARGPALRPLLARDRRLRAAHRPGAVHRRDADGDRLQAPVGPGARALDRPPPGPRRPRCLHRERDRPGPRASPGVRDRDAPRPHDDRPAPGTCADPRLLGERRAARGARDGGRR